MLTPGTLLPGSSDLDPGGYFLALLVITGNGSPRAPQAPGMGRSKACSFLPFLVGTPLPWVYPVLLGDR